MPQPMAARTMRKAIAASTMPSTLPPTSTSESSPPSAPAVASLPDRGPRDRAYRPPAKRAGRPAPAIRPNTTIFQSALRLIHMGLLPFSRSGRCGLDRRVVLRRHAAGPLCVHVLVVDLGGAGAPEDEPADDRQDDDVHDD